MTEEMAKVGKSRIIKNLAPSLTERGKIKIGEKGKMITSQGGSKFQLPKKLEYFRVVSLHRGDDGNYIGDEAVHERYGEKPTELPVRLLFDDIELNFQCRYSCFKGKQQWCSGDGEYGWRIENGERKAFKCPCHRQDPAYEGKDKCKINSCLSVLIDGVETIGGVWKFRTTSYNSTVGLLSSLTLIKSVTGGPLAGIPLTLYISPKTVVSPTDGNVQTIYIVGLEYKGSFNQLQELGYSHALDRQKHMIRMEDIEDNARKLLQAGDSIVDEDVVEEFYPEQMINSEQKAADLTNKIKEKPDYTATELKDKLDAGDEQIEGYSHLTPEERKLQIAQDLKDKLDAGDKQVEGYKEGLTPTVDAQNSTDLEQDEAPGVLPAGVDAIEWLTGCRPSSSVSNAKAFLAVYEEQKFAIDGLAEKIQTQLKNKLEKTLAHLAQIEANKKQIEDEEPPIPEEDQIPAFEPDQKEELVDNGRLAYISAMNKYKGIDEEQYQAILKEYEFADLNAVPHTKVDQDYILGLLSEKLGG